MTNTKTGIFVTFKQLYEVKLTDTNLAGKRELWLNYITFLYNTGAISDLQYIHWNDPYLNV
jgi:hypothetical protein